MTEVTLDERVRQLEAAQGRLRKENRRLRLGMFAVLAVVAALVCIAATKPVAKVVRAQSFEIVDAQGRVRIDLGMGGKVVQVPGVALFDENGARRAALGLALDGSPSLTLRDKKGKTRAMLSLGFNGSTGLRLFGERDNTRARLTVRPDGSSGVVLSADNGIPRAGLRVSSDGTPDLSLWDEKGKVRAGLGAPDSVPPDSGESDNEGKVIWKAPPD